MRKAIVGDALRVPQPYRAYIERLARATEDMREIAASFGLPLEDAAHAQARNQRTGELARALREQGCTFRNDGKSIVANALSPACERCRTGRKSVSLFLSLACPRSCWFCFNENQFDFKRYRNSIKDWKNELDAYASRMGTLDYIALTGGEPLLHPEETISFIKHAKKLNSESHVRLYTSGWRLDSTMAEKLARAGLDEIRFSVKLAGDAGENDTFEESLEEQLSRIRSTIGLIPCVMVEMPVIPGTQSSMRYLLTELDDMGAYGINLLELCFPLHNAKAYANRDLAVVRDPYRIAYQYNYAGALPIAGSEEEAMALMHWALDEGLSLGMHYCSLENKNTAQIFDQNHGGNIDIPPYHFSSTDFFYKTVRAFGESAARVAQKLDRVHAAFECDEECTMVAFDPSLLGLMEAPASSEENFTLFLASAVIEPADNGGERFREIGLHVIEPNDIAAAARGAELSATLSSSPFGPDALETKAM